MGYIVNTALVVTGYRERYGSAPTIAEAHVMARSICGSLVSPIVDGRANDTASFMIAPHGSKSGWETAEVANTEREEFVSWLREKRGYFAWFVVDFGGDFGRAVVRADGAEV